MPSQKHKWRFVARFKRNAYGWHSSKLAVKRVKEAASEIKKVARRKPVLGAEGAVKFLERISPALAHVDSSSGAIGTAVNSAIAALVPIIANADADDRLRDRWLERLWRAVEEDDIPYIELLPDYWGTLCVTAERASYWANEFIDIVESIWKETRGRPGGYFKGTSACLSCLFKAGRYERLLNLLELSPHRFWAYRQWGVKALAAMGKKGEAIRYAEDSRGLNEPDIAISMACEEILLSSGMAEEAYRRYALEANQRNTYLATFRAIAKKYPHKKPLEILNDLVKSTPGEEGKWFAAAKSAGLLEEAILLAQSTPCDPRTLTRAAGDMADKEPWFAVESGIAALKWISEGYGYDITGLDVLSAFNNTVEVAQKAGTLPETMERIRALVENEKAPDGFVSRILVPRLRLKG